MKNLVGMAALLVILFGLAFHFDGSVRETTIYLAASPEKKKLIDAYREGRDLFFSKWTGKATEMAYWGDDSYVSAQQIRGDVWVASGRVSFVMLATPKREPWVCLFDRRTHEMIYAVGTEADQALQRINRGELNALRDVVGSEDRNGRPGRAVSYDPAVGWIEHDANVGRQQAYGR